MSRRRGTTRVLEGGPWRAQRDAPLLQRRFSGEVSAGQKSQRKALEFHGICVSRLVVFEWSPTVWVDTVHTCFANSSSGKGHVQIRHFPTFFLEQMHLTDALWFQRCVALKDVEIHRFEGWMIPSCQATFISLKAKSHVGNETLCFKLEDWSNKRSRLIDQHNLWNPVPP